MKQQSYDTYPIASGDLVFGFRNGNPLETANFSGIQSAGTTSYLETVVEISDTEIKTQLVSGIQLLEAPETNTYYDIIAMYFELDFGTIAYTAPDDLKVSGAYKCLVSAGLLDSTVDNIAIVKTSLSLSPTSTIVDAVPLEAALLLSSDSNPTLGNGTLRIVIQYNIRTFGT